MFWNRKKKEQEPKEQEFKGFRRDEPEKTKELSADEKSAAEFNRLYKKDPNAYIRIADCEGQEVGVSVENDLKVRSNDILIINSSHESTIERIFVPIVEQGQTSYIIYDPYGDIYGRLEETLKRKNYDIRIVDFSKNTDSTDRVNIFEAANLLRDPSEIVRIIAGSFENRKDADVAAPMIEAVCNYILEKGVELNAARVAWVLRQLKKNNKRIIGDMELSPLAGAALKKRTSGVTKEVFFGVIDELERRVAPAIEKFGSNPSIYGILTNKKNVAIFVKSVEAQYRFVSTAMMYNLAVMSAALDDFSLNTIVMDEKNDEWYDREEIKRWSDENKNRKDCIIRLSVRDKIPADMFRYFAPSVVLYNGSVDNLTIDYIYKALEKQYELSKDDNVAEQIMDRHELETMLDCIVFCNTSNKGMSVRPFRCTL